MDSFVPPPLSAHRGVDSDFKPPPLSSHKGLEKQPAGPPGLLQRFGETLMGVPEGFLAALESVGSPGRAAVQGVQAFASNYGQHGDLMRAGLSTTPAGSVTEDLYDKNLPGLVGTGLGFLTLGGLAKAYQNPGGALRTASTALEFARHPVRGATKFAAREVIQGLREVLREDPAKAPPAKGPTPGTTPSVDSSIQYYSEQPGGTSVRPPRTGSESYYADQQRRYATPEAPAAAPEPAAPASEATPATVTPELLNQIARSLGAESFEKAGENGQRIVRGLAEDDVRKQNAAAQPAPAEAPAAPPPQPPAAPEGFTPVAPGVTVLDLIKQEAAKRQAEAAAAAAPSPEPPVAEPGPAAAEAVPVAEPAVQPPAPTPVPAPVKGNYTDAETRALAEYRSESDPVNMSLRDESRQTHPDVTQIDQALTKKTLPDQTTVYRGFSKPTGYSAGDSFVEKGFSSTTTDKDLAALEFARRGDLAIINVPKGANYVPLSEIHHPGIWSPTNQGEMLFPRGMRYTVRKTEFDPALGPNGKTLIYLDAEPAAAEAVPVAEPAVQPAAPEPEMQAAPTGVDEMPQPVPQPPGGPPPPPGAGATPAPDLTDQLQASIEQANAEKAAKAAADAEAKARYQAAVDAKIAAARDKAANSIVENLGNAGKTPADIPPARVDFPPGEAGDAAFQAAEKAFGGPENIEAFWHNLGGGHRKGYKVGPETRALVRTRMEAIQAAKAANTQAVAAKLLDAGTTSEAVGKWPPNLYESIGITPDQAGPLRKALEALEAREKGPFSAAASASQ